MPELFRVADDPTPPDLPGRVTLRPTLDELIDAVSAEVFLAANECVRAFGDFHLALPPGRVGVGLCSRLMIDPLYRSLPWRRTHVWLTREGDHPPSDERSAYRQIADLIEHHSGIPEANLHETALTTDERASAYQDELRQTLAWRERGQDRLDAILLDVSQGPPPPGDGELVSTHGQGITLTRDVIASARSVALFALGRESGVVDSETAYREWTFSDDPHRLAGGELRWYLDHAAAGAEHDQAPDANDRNGSAH